MDKYKKIAVFDICDTLYKCNTTYKYIEFITERRGFFPQDYIIFKLFNKVFNIVFSIDIIRNYNIKRLKGYKEKMLKDKAKEFVSKIDRNESIFELLNKFKRNDFEVILLSATVDPVAESIGECVGAKRVYSSELNFSSKNICDGTIGRDLLGNKKDTMYELSLVSNELVFVTDNKSDSSCIELCDEFIAVVPSGRKKNYEFWKDKGIRRIICL